MHEDRGRGYFEESDRSRPTVAGSLAGVFALMFAGLLVSAFAALYVIQSPAMLRLVYGTRFGFSGFLIAEIVLVIVAVPRIWRMGAAGGLLIFFLYALLNGVTLSTVFLTYSAGTIFLAFFAAAGMFGVMAVYGALTKADLSRFGSLLFMGLSGLIIATLINFFWGSSSLDTVLCYGGVVLFVALTAYDVQRIRRQMELYPEAPEMALMVMGALNLYLDFVNLFLYLLRLLSRGNRR